MHVRLSGIEDAWLDLDKRIVEVGLQEASLMAINLAYCSRNIYRDMLGRNADEIAIAFVETHDSIRPLSRTTLFHKPKRGDLCPERTGKLGKA